MDETLSGLDSLLEEKIVERILGPQGLFQTQGITVILATHSSKHITPLRTLDMLRHLLCTKYSQTL